MAEIEPADLIQIALQQPDNIGIAYTYSEPLMWYEYVRDCASLAHQAGLVNVLVTNGFINPEPMAELLPVIDALNIDIKGFTDEFYRRIVRGSYQPVLAAAQQARQAGCHLEITTLLIPGLNDGEDEIRNLISWIADHLGQDTPLHFSRYFPNYKMKLQPTPMVTLQRAQALARQQLHYVYLGNVDGDHDTRCPRCAAVLVQRNGIIKLQNINAGECRHCGFPIAIVGMET